MYARWKEAPCQKLAQLFDSLNYFRQKTNLWEAQTRVLWIVGLVGINNVKCSSNIY